MNANNKKNKFDTQKSGETNRHSQIAESLGNDIEAINKQLELAD